MELTIIKDEGTVKWIIHYIIKQQKMLIAVMGFPLFNDNLINYHYYVIKMIYFVFP